MKYKMICIDMDGTLLGKRKRISERNKNAIKQAHDKGIEQVGCIIMQHIFQNF